MFTEGCFCFFVSHPAASLFHKISTTRTTKVPKLLSAFLSVQMLVSANSVSKHGPIDFHQIDFLFKTRVFRF